jgi:hypothetical protein
MIHLLPASPTLSLSPSWTTNELVQHRHHCRPPDTIDKRSGNLQPRRSQTSSTTAASIASPTTTNNCNNGRDYQQAWKKFNFFHIINFLNKINNQSLCKNQKR